MAKNKIGDLRDHLFETLEELKDKQKPLDLDRARAIADVGRVIVDSAKVEVEFLKVTGQIRSTDFMPGDPALEEPRPKPKLAAGGR